MGATGAWGHKVGLTGPVLREGMPLFSLQGPVAAAILPPGAGRGRQTTKSSQGTGAP